MKIDKELILKIMGTVFFTACIFCLMLFMIGSNPEKIYHIVSQAPSGYFLAFAIVMAVGYITIGYFEYRNQEGAKTK